MSKQISTSKRISKPDMAETNLKEINQIMTNQILDLLKDKLTELKGDIDPKILRKLPVVNRYIGRGFRYGAYESLVEQITTFFREYCTPEWYPNNTVEQPLDVSGYHGAEGNSKLKTELMNAYALTSVKDNINAKYNTLKNYSIMKGNLGNLYGFGAAKFRRWMNKNDQNDAPPTRAKILMLSFIRDTRNHKNKDDDEEEYKQGRLTAMCFALLVTEELTKGGGDYSSRDSTTTILGAAMIHALITYAAGSQPLWQHICDVIYPPDQHKEENVLFDYVAACTMGDHHNNFSIKSYGIDRYSIHVSAEDALGFFLNNDVIESVRKWGELGVIHDWEFS